MIFCTFSTMCRALTLDQVCRSNTEMSHFSKTFYSSVETFIVSLTNCGYPVVIWVSEISFLVLFHQCFFFSLCSLSCRDIVFSSSDHHCLSLTCCHWNIKLAWHYCALYSTSSSKTFTSFVHFHTLLINRTIYVHFICWSFRTCSILLTAFWRQHPTKQQLYGHLPPIMKTIKIRWTRHAGHCWGSRDKLTSDVLLWTPSHDQAKAGRLAQTYIQQLCVDTGCSPEGLPEVMDDREGWRERVREIHDDDDYLLRHICVFLLILTHENNGFAHLMLTLTSSTWLLESYKEMLKHHVCL